MATQTDMNGLWSGTYSYDMVEGETVFTVWINDQSGQLSGTIIEPNTFVPNGFEELHAPLDGICDGNIVDFVKTYDPSSGAHQSPIHYEGTVNPSFTEVRGIWHFKDPHALPGKFVLSRVSNSLEKEVMRSKLASISNDAD